MGKVSAYSCFFLSVLDLRWRMSMWSEECGSVEKKVKKGSTWYRRAVSIRLLLEDVLVLMVLQLEAEKLIALTGSAVSTELLVSQDHNLARWCFAMESALSSTRLRIGQQSSRPPWQSPYSSLIFTVAVPFREYVG